MPESSKPDKSELAEADEAYKGIGKPWAPPAEPDDRELARADLARQFAESEKLNSYRNPTPGTIFWTIAVALGAAAALLYLWLR